MPLSVKAITYTKSENLKKPQFLMCELKRSKLYDYPCGLKEKYIWKIWTKGKSKLWKF